MAKFYIKSDSFEVIFSTNQNAYNACRRVIHEILPNDTLDEYMYLDERGYRDYTSADTTTYVIDSEQILRKEGYIK